LLLIQCKISLYLGLVQPVRCFVTPLALACTLLFRMEIGLHRGNSVDYYINYC